jgi:hypothetical protein
MGASCATPRATRHAVRAPAVRALALSLALLLALPLAPAAFPIATRTVAAQSQPGDALSVARAFDTAWNRHDLDAVVAAFAPDAVVRQATTFTSSGGGHVVVADVYGARLQYGVGAEPYTVEGDEVVWRGRAAIRLWAVALFALRHRADASGFTFARGPGDLGDGGEGDERNVAWLYRAHVDFFQAIPGVPPAEGTATVTVRAGAITALALDGSVDARTRRDEAVSASLQAAGERSALAQSQVPVAVPAVPAVVLQAPAWQDGAWPLSLVALGVGAYALALGRGRARRH